MICIESLDEIIHKQYVKCSIMRNTIHNNISGGFEMLFKHKENIIHFRLVFTHCIKIEIVEQLVGFWT